MSPTTLAAQNARWSPDGARIVFISPRETPDGSIVDVGFVYTMRPDGSDVRRLDRRTVAATGRDLDARRADPVHRESGNAPGWWTMDADGTNAAPSCLHDALGVAVGELRIDRIRRGSRSVARRIVPLPWTPATAVAVGPPAPTPRPDPDTRPGSQGSAGPARR